MELISKERAQAFAEALILHHGNATAAARSLEYDSPSAPATGTADILWCCELWHRFHKRTLTH